MIFLNTFYQQIYLQYSTKINHFPLIRLIFFSVDKTIFYFLLFLIIRYCYYKLHPKQKHWQYELLLNIFVIYLLLLFFLTVFRRGYFPWDFHFYLHRSLTDINLHPFIETFKLTSGKSILDFIYNFGGNIAWFIPWGFLYPIIKSRTVHLWETALTGFLLSVLIESLQFVLFTGVSDIDDVIFNTLGAILGYGCYYIYHLLFS